MMFYDDNAPDGFKKVHIAWDTLPTGHYPYTEIYEDPDGALYHRREIKHTISGNFTVTGVQQFVDEFKESGHDPDTTHVRWHSADTGSGYRAELIATVYEPLNEDVTNVIRRAQKEYERRRAQRNWEFEQERVDKAIELVRQYRPEALKEDTGKSLRGWPSLHECEPWQMRPAPDGNRYCAACGKKEEK